MCNTKNFWVSFLCHVLTQKFLGVFFVSCLDTKKHKKTQKNTKKTQKKHKNYDTKKNTKKNTKMF